MDLEPLGLQATLMKLALALGLGLLMGLQRERVDNGLAGIRTFPLIALLGALLALLAPAFGPWPVVAGLLALALMVLVADLAKLRSQPRSGITSEVAVLLTYGMGAYLVVGHTVVAVVLTGTAVLLLHLKAPMHRAVSALSERDVTAVMQFALITLVILPVLPDATYGPYEVLNPYKIWLMVVLIVAINLAGFVVRKLSGAQVGSLLGGLVGGLVSSTATTVGYARRSRAEGGGGAGANLAALVIVVAATVAMARTVAEVLVVAPRAFAEVGPPLAALLGWWVVLSLLAWWRGRGGAAETPPEPGNPAELKPALVFGAIYGAVILATAFAKDRFGDAGLVPVALLSGLTDMDAITLSTANLAADGRLEGRTAWRLIVIAAMANMLFKAGCAVALGSAALRVRVLGYFGAALAGAGGILVLWP